MACSRYPKAPPGRGPEGRVDEESREVALRITSHIPPRERVRIPALARKAILRRLGGGACLRTAMSALKFWKDTPERFKRHSRRLHMARFPRASWGGLRHRPKDFLHHDGRRSPVLPGAHPDSSIFWHGNQHRIAPGTMPTPDGAHDIRRLHPLHRRRGCRAGGIISLARSAN